MISGQETDRAYSNKKPQLPEPAQGQIVLEFQILLQCFIYPQRLLSEQENYNT